MADPRAFGLFVSAVEGQPVRRYGTPSMIGAERTVAAPNVITYDTALVVAIPVEESDRYLREYTRALRDGSLIQRTAEEWLAQQQPESGEPDTMPPLPEPE